MGLSNPFSQKKQDDKFKAALEKNDPMTEYTIADPGDRDEYATFVTDNKERVKINRKTGTAVTLENT